MFHLLSYCGMGGKWTTPILLSVKLLTKTWWDKKTTCQVEGLMAKQAPRTSSTPRQESVYNNQNLEETNPTQTRSSADDATCPRPAIGKHVIDMPAERKVGDVLELSSTKTTVNIGTWNVRSLLGSGKSDLLIRGGFKTQPPVDRRLRLVLGGCHC